MGDRLWAALAGREEQLFNLGATMVFYDLTTTYFEGAASGNKKATRLLAG